MVEHRIKELRERRGWSQEHLGSLIGRSKSVISRLEDGSTRLDLEVAKKVAAALNVTLAEVLGISDEDGYSTGLEDDGARYVADPGDPLQAFVTSPNRYLFRVDSDAVDKAGIRRGDVAIIDDSATACSAVRALQVVLVMHHPEDGGNAVSLLRQFVPPDLLITNSSTSNAKSLDRIKDDATIVGVVIGSHRSFAKAGA